MTKAKWLWGMLKWMVMTERQKVASRLKVANLKPFMHPHDSPAPTVDIDTRCRLESIRDIKLDGYHLGLSSEARGLVVEAFNSTVRERKYTTTIPHLH